MSATHIEPYLATMLWHSRGHFSDDCVDSEKRGGGRERVESDNGLGVKFGRVR